MHGEEEDVLHSIVNGYPYDGLHPEDWVTLLFEDSTLLSAWPLETRLELIRYLAKHNKFRPLVLNQLKSFL